MASDSIHGVPRQVSPRRTCLPVLLLAAAACMFQAPTTADAFAVPPSPAAMRFKTAAADSAATPPPARVHPQPQQHMRQLPRPLVLIPSPLRSAPPRIAELDEMLATEKQQSASSSSRRFFSRRSRESKERGAVQMTFLGTKTVSTPPVPLPPAGSGASTDKSLDDFFATDEFRNLLFFRNGVTAVRNPTREQLDIWSSELKLGGGCELDNGGRISPTQQVIQIKTYLNMPGLKILTINTIGAKLLLPTKGGGGGLGTVDVASHRRRRLYPEYQFTLIDSDLKPEGAKPLVWLFNRLIRFRESTSSFTRVKATNAGGVDCDKVVFTTEARLETRIRLSKSALRAMPVNVDNFERQGSQSIQRLLEKELEPALLGFRDAYLEWMKT